MSGGVRIPGLSRRLRTSVYDHVFDNDTHEVGGVLVGLLGDDDMPVVTGCIAALEARGERASVTFTHDAWSSIHARMESEFPDRQIVGWYHSHPGFGIFLSGHDMFIQENFFSDERQIAYVVDPHAGTEGVFGWREGKVTLLEEGPAGRRGTGGRGGDAERSRPGWMRYGGLATVVVAFVAVGLAVLMSGGSKPPPRKVPRASTSTTAAARPSLRRKPAPEVASAKKPDSGGKPRQHESTAAPAPTTTGLPLTTDPSVVAAPSHRGEHGR